MVTKSYNIIGMIGVRFGSLTVESRAGSNKRGTTWNCICDCGRTCVTSADRLKSGNKNHCGCLKKVGSPTDLSGKKYGRLTVVGFDGHQGLNRMWRCVCDCGRVTRVSTGSLNSNGSRSCGCLQKEIVSKTMRKHGASTSEEYRTWVGIKNRCYNVKNKAYIYYGGSKISVYRPWIKSFELFLQHMGKKPSGKYSIERIDNTRGYEPGNVMWLETKLQAQNTRRSVKITWNGETKCMSQWARDLGINRRTLEFRVKSGVPLPMLFSKSRLHRNTGNIRRVRENGSARWVKSK